MRSIRLDKAELFLNVCNMTIFTVSSVLFFWLYVKDQREKAPAHLNISSKTHRVHNKIIHPSFAYGLAHVTNILASLAYLIINAWSLNQHFVAESAAARADPNTADDFYYNRIFWVNQTSRLALFVADCVYLACAISMEIGWLVEEDEPIADFAFDAHLILDRQTVEIIARNSERNKLVKKGDSETWESDSDRAAVSTPHNEQSDRTGENSDNEENFNLEADIKGDSRSFAYTDKRNEFFSALPPRKDTYH